MDVAPRTLRGLRVVLVLLVQPRSPWLHKRHPGIQREDRDVRREERDPLPPTETKREKLVS